MIITEIWVKPLRLYLTRVIEERSTKGLANLLPDCISPTIDVKSRGRRGPWRQWFHPSAPETDSRQRTGNGFAPAHRKRIRASTGEINETNHRGLERLRQEESRLLPDCVSPTFDEKFRGRRGPWRQGFHPSAPENGFAPRRGKFFASSTTRGRHLASRTSLLQCPRKVGFPDLR